MKRLLLETSFSKIYILVVSLITVIILGGYFSYAMFTVSKEKSNAISIVTGNLTYKLTVDGSNSSQLVIPAKSSKTFTVTLSNPNNRIARFNFYYTGSIPAGVTAGYITGTGGTTPSTATGVNLQASGASGSSNVYKIRVVNSNMEEKRITLGVSVGLDYNNLSLPSDGHLFTEYQLIGTEEIIYKTNANYSSYNDLNEYAKKETVKQTQVATSQTTSLTDYRYVGEEPNNYINFNDELWRIIGVFSVDDGTGKLEERIKLIRNESIGDYSWDNKDTTTGAEDDSGKNSWSDARLNYLLNPGHESATGGSLYWNSKSGTCYAGQYNATTPCDFTTTGLKEEAKEMISDALWYLGTVDRYDSSSNGLTSQWYAYERSKNVYSGRSISWKGKVGLLYISDYGYATGGGTQTDRNTCLNTEIYNWNRVSDCYVNNYLYEPYYQWSIVVRGSSPRMGIRIASYGYIRANNVAYANLIKPVVYLNPDLKIISGDGSINSPYIIKQSS